VQRDAGNPNDSRSKLRQRSLLLFCRARKTESLMASRRNAEDRQNDKADRKQGRQNRGNHPPGSCPPASSPAGFQNTWITRGLKTDLMFTAIIQKKDCADRNCSRSPRKERPPGALIGRKAISRKVTAPRTFEKILEKPPRVGPRGSSFFISHKHGVVLHRWSYFAITALIVTFLEPTFCALKPSSVMSHK
jgi:hypothetical protein